MIDLAKKKEDIHGRLAQYLLKELLIDGGEIIVHEDCSTPSFVSGQWDMLVNLVNKYGVVPKNAFPESSSSEAALLMNKFLRTKVNASASERTSSLVSFLLLSYVPMPKRFSSWWAKETSKRVNWWNVKVKWWKKYAEPALLVSMVEHSSRSTALWPLVWDRHPSSLPLNITILRSSIKRSVQSVRSNSIHKLSNPSLMWIKKWVRGGFVRDSHYS